jgi:hypothetical protein
MGNCCEGHEGHHGGHIKEGCCCGGECHCGSHCCCECCGEGRSFQRRYMTKAEKIAELEGYLDELKKEVQAVEEMLEDLRK